MNYGEKASELKKSMNCGQSVIVALSDLASLDEAQAKAMGTAMGGGLRCGEACGAFVGGALALGLAVGADGRGSPDSPVAAVTKQYAEDFKTKFGAIRCADLMAINGGDKSVCNGYCAWCAEHVAGIIEEK